MWRHVLLPSAEHISWMRHDIGWILIRCNFWSLIAKPHTAVGDKLKMKLWREFLGATVACYWFATPLRYPWSGIWQSHTGSGALGAKLLLPMSARGHARNC